MLAAQQVPSPPRRPLACLGPVRRPHARLVVIALHQGVAEVARARRRGVGPPRARPPGARRSRPVAGGRYAVGVESVVVERGVVRVGGVEPVVALALVWRCVLPLLVQDNGHVQREVRAGPAAAEPQVPTAAAPVPTEPPPARGRRGHPALVDLNGAAAPVVLLASASLLQGRREDRRPLEVKRRRHGQPVQVAGVGPRVPGPGLPRRVARLDAVPLPLLNAVRVARPRVRPVDGRHE